MGRCSSRLRRALVLCSSFLLSPLFLRSLLLLVPLSCTTSLLSRRSCTSHCSRNCLSSMTLTHLRLALRVREVQVCPVERWEQVPCRSIWHAQRIQSRRLRLVAFSYHVQDQTPEMLLEPPPPRSPLAPRLTHLSREEQRRSLLAALLM